MQLDVFLSILAILLGALITYTIDEQFQVLPRLGEWLGRLMEQ